MMKASIFVLVLCTLGACSNENQVYGLGVVPQSVTGDENAVSVFNVWSAGAAMPLAERHCQNYGKRASYERMSGITAIFSCVAR
jgi:hypothetical protein